MTLPPAEAQNDAMLLRSGQQLAANGYGTTGVLGTAIAVQAIGPSPQHLSAAPQPGPPEPPEPPGHRGPPPPRP